MGVVNFIKSQMIYEIELNLSDENVLMRRFEDEGKYIMMGAKLSVNPEQMAAFVYKGYVTDTFNSGMYTLSTANVPVLAKFKHWDSNFEGHFKSSVYFFSLAEKEEQAWGISPKINIKDYECGEVLVGANGYYKYKIVAPELFFNQLGIPTDSLSTLDCRDELNQIITDVFVSTLKEENISVSHAYNNVNFVSHLVRKKLIGKFEEYGLKLLYFEIRGIVVPQEVERAIFEKNGSSDDLAEPINTGSSVVDYPEDESSYKYEDSENIEEIEEILLESNQVKDEIVETKNIETSSNEEFYENDNDVSKSDYEENKVAKHIFGVVVEPKEDIVPSYNKVICSKCKSQVDKGTKFCLFCGNDISVQAESVKNCVKCGAALESDTKFCSNCGANQNVERVCISCGKKISDTAKFCIYCGKKQ